MPGCPWPAAIVGPRCLGPALPILHLRPLRFECWAGPGPGIPRLTHRDDDEVRVNAAPGEAPLSRP